MSLAKEKSIAFRKKVMDARKKKLLKNTNAMVFTTKEIAYALKKTTMIPSNYIDHLLTYLI